MNIMPKINNDGQVLLIVTIALATLLGVGLSVSNQTLSSITRTSQTDSFQKVTAAAEGGLEKYLLLTDSELNTKVGANNLIENFDSSNTRATVTIEDITTGDEGLTFPEIAVNQVGTFFFSNSLDSQTFNGQKTCLKITTSTSNPDFMLNVIVKNTSVQNFSPITALNATYDATTSNQYLMEKYIYKDGSFSSGVSPESCGNNSYRFTNAAILRILPLKNDLHLLVKNK